MNLADENQELDMLILKSLLKGKDFEILKKANFEYHFKKQGN